MYFQVETLALPGANVQRLTEDLERRCLRGYDFVVLHVGECAMFSKRGKRLAFPKQLAEELLKLYHGVCSRVDADSCHVVLGGLLPKAVPSSREQEDAVFRQSGITRYASLEYNKSARKLNRIGCVLCCRRRSARMPSQQRLFPPGDEEDRQTPPCCARTVCTSSVPGVRLWPGTLGRPWGRP